MQLLLYLFSQIRRLFYRLRRFWRSIYYTVTNLLIILGASALLSAFWYFCFFR